MVSRTGHNQSIDSESGIPNSYVIVTPQKRNIVLQCFTTCLIDSFPYMENGIVIFGIVGKLASTSPFPQNRDYTVTFHTSAP